jgi:hypothetical protein
MLKKKTKQKKHIPARRENSAVVVFTYGASDLKPTRRQAPLGGDGDDCLLVDHRATTLENPISRPLNKMRSVRLRCGLPPVTQPRDVLKESRPRIEKAWTTRGQLSTTWQLSTAGPDFPAGVVPERRPAENISFFRHGEFTLLAASKLLKRHRDTAAAINSNAESEQKDHHLTTSKSYSQAQAAG